MNLVKEKKIDHALSQESNFLILSFIDFILLLDFSKTLSEFFIILDEWKSNRETTNKCKYKNERLISLECC